MEASGNSFQVVRTLKTLERKAIVLESNQLGKLKEVHANNDKLSAVRIAKAYLAGTAKEVWVPDAREPGTARHLSCPLQKSETHYPIAQPAPILS